MRRSPFSSKSGLRPDGAAAPAIKTRPAQVDGHQTPLSGAHPRDCGEGSTRASPRGYNLRAARLPMLCHDSSLARAYVRKYLVNFYDFTLVGKWAN